MFGGQRFRRRNIESSSGNFFLLQRPDQRFLVYQSAARNVDEISGGLHSAKYAVIEHLQSLFSVGRTAHQHVNLWNHLEKPAWFTQFGHKVGLRQWLWV